MKKSSKIIWTIALVVLVVLIGIVAFGYLQKLTAKDQKPIATMEVENFGTIKMELYPDVAPETVANFITLANRGFYDGLTFHRIVKDFMIQGGDQAGDGTGSAKLSNLRDLKEGEEDEDYTIKGEFILNKFDNKLKMKEGVLAMARSSSYDSASSQFFIVTKDTSSLDGSYAGFGKVIEGMDIVHKIEEVEVKAKEGATEVSTPVNTVKINSIRVETNGVDYGMPNTIAPQPVYDYSSLYEQMGIDPSTILTE
ncbi:MAG: peptidylprolyl isomerase [Clostridia bacterium]|nr:peptidylprolyl isomerase [Clostridia bacterium]